MAEFAEARRQRKANRRVRIAGILRGRPTLGPQTVHFDIANGCNTRCTSCWHHSPHLDPSARPTMAWKRTRLTLATFQRRLDSLLSLGGLEEIILSGMGDPSLNPELNAMVRYARTRRIGVTVLTNLLRLDLAELYPELATTGRAERLGAARSTPEFTGDLQLLVSICGVTPASWQAFHAHPVSGGFARLLQQLAWLQSRGVRPKHVQVITRDTVAELPAMVRFAHAHDAARVSFKLASLSRGTEAVALTAEQRHQLVERWLPEARAEAERLGVQTDLSAFARQLQPGRHATTDMAEVGCFMGHLYARITVDGEVLFCCNTGLSMGRLGRVGPGAAPDGAEEDASPSLAELWRGPTWQALRDELRAGRYQPGCEQCGKFKQNLKWSQRLAAGLPPGAMERLIGMAP